jgi:AraC-like DNA-binding protein
METHTVTKAPLVRMSIVRDILFYAEKQGANLQFILLESGIRQVDFENPDFMLPRHQVDLVWQVATQATQNINLGLDMGSATQPGILGLAGHLYQTCPHLLEAVRCLERFNNLFGNSVKLHVVEKHDLVGICFDSSGFIHSGSFGARQGIDAWMSAVRYIFERAGAARPKPVAVHTSCKRDDRRAAYEHHFAPATLVMSVEEDIIWYKREDLEAPQITSDPELYRHFLKLAQEKLDEMQGADQIANQVRQLLLTTFNQGFHGIEFIADKLHMTPRTLQRRLQAQGYTFSQILEEMKQEMSFKLLRSRQHSISEIAYMLGFSEPGSFSRSFRKWTGTTPKHYLN